jgi:hypothetical protein
MPDPHADLREWQTRRRLRIARLSLFLGRATTIIATDNDPTGWWAAHAIWAIQRLEALDYRFPEVDITPLPPRIDIAAKAA